MRRLPLLLCLIIAIGTGCRDHQSSQTSDSNQPNDSPEIPAPKIEAPEIPAPEIPAPEIPAPSIPAPKIRADEIEPPVIPVPEIKAPEIKVPEITAPNIRVQGNDSLILLTLPADVLFDFDKHTIRPDAESALRQILAAVTKRYPKQTLQISGHTDSIASAQYNQDLSERRATSVERWLSEHGVAKARMIVQGYGEKRPIVPNLKPDGIDDPAGRQQNRRVEILIQK